MATRSKMIDELVQINSNKAQNTHFIYDDPVFREEIDKSVHKLEDFISYNSRLEDAFKKLHKKVHGVEELEIIKGQFEGLGSIVG